MITTQNTCFFIFTYQLIKKLILILGGKKMKKIVCILAMLLFTTSMAFGAYVEIGTGTTATSSVPTNGLWDYSWSQVIYLQSEIGDAIDINKISYNVSTEPDSYTMPDQKIYMKHTADATFPDAAYDDPATVGFTLVYDGPVTWDGSGWNDIMLDTPFIYNGTDNLIVYWQNWDGDWTSGYPQFYYTSQTDRAKYKYQDNSFPEVSGTLDVYVANIRLHYLYDGPEIYLSASSYDFGMIEADTDASFDLTIYSAGTEDLVITDAVVAAPFSCDYSGGTIPAGENVVTTVWFEPTEAGEYSDTLTFEIDGDFAGMNTALLTGSAYPSDYVFESFEGDIFPPLAWDVQNVAGQDWAQYSSGSPPDGSKHARLYYVSGTGSQSRLITPELLTLNSGDFTKFMARYYSAGTLTIQYSTDKETWTDLEIVPITTTYDEYTVDLSSLADGESYYLAFYGETGTGYSYMYLDAVYIPEPEPYSVITLSPVAYDFGSILTGSSASLDVGIKNAGIDDLTISGISGLDAPFSCDYTGGVLAPDDSVTISILFDGSVPGVYADTLVIESDADYGEGTVALSGAVYDPFTELSEDFEGCTAPDLPLGWSKIVQSTSTSSYVNTYSGATYAHSGVMSVKMYNYSDLSAELLLITPALITSANGNRVMFWARSSYGTQNLPVGIITDPTDPATFTALDTVEVTNTYTEYYFEYLAPTEDYIYLAVKHGLDGTYDSYYIDDFVYEEIPPVPVMVLSDSTYDFGWVEEGTTPSWDMSITNDGSVDLIISGVDVDLPFSCTYPDTILPGDTEVATIYLDASNPGIYEDVLTFNSNAIGDSTIELSGIVYGSDYVVEGFEDVEFPPFGWSNPDGYWKRFTNDAYEGDGYARVSWYHEDDAILYSPHLIIESGDIINFYWINANLYDGKDGKVNDADITYFEISNNGTDWEVLATLNPEEEMTEYEFVCVAVPDDYIGINAEVRWRHVTENIGESRGVGLDNVMLPQPYLPINFYLDPYTQSDYDSIGATVAYDIDIYNTGIQADRYYISLADSKTRGRDVEDFESDDGGYVGTGLWQWGSPTSGPGNAHSGVNVWATNLSGDYEANANYTLDSPEIAIGSDEPTLTFWHWYDTEASFDGGNVKISTDGGATWTVIEPVGGYPGTSNSSNPLYPEPVFCGHGQGFWEQVTFELSTYAGQTASFRWHLGSDGSVQYPGWYIDDVDITSGGGPPPPPSGWPVTFSDDYLDIEPGEMGTFTASVEIPDDGSVIEDDVNTSTIYVESRENPLVNHEAGVVTTAHPKDPYEPNNVIVDATPWAYGEITEGAQIYYNPDYADKDIDIYEFSGLAGDIILCDFILPPDELLFDGAIKLVDVDSTEIDFADEWGPGGSEQLKHRLLVDGTYYLVLGKWDNILDGPYKKDTGRGVNTCFYAMSLELIPSPDIAVSPDSLQLGIVASKETASVDMFIENTGVTGCDDLAYNIEIDFPGIVTLFDEGFESGDLPPDWSQEYVNGTIDWAYTNGGHSGHPSTAHTGDFNALFYGGSYTPYATMLITPELDLGGKTDYVLSFWHAQVQWAGDQDILNVYYKTSAAGTWTLLQSYSTEVSTWTERIINLPNPSGTYYIAFEGVSGYGWGVCVDDVMVKTGTPWCSVEPLAGSIGQGAIQTCVVTCDETGLTEPGIYTADIIVHNNALLYGASDVTIPLTFFYQVEAQGLQGTVTFEVTGEPIDSVKVSAGNFVTYTDSLGFYSFDEIASGIYDVVFEKDGFATYTAYGIYVSPDWITLLNVSMLFDGPVPENFSATGVEEAIELDWDKPSGGGGGGTEYEIVYDDGVAENATAWYDAGNMNAVRFTPDGYPCTIISADMNVYDGSWPVGSLLQPFEVAVFDDDGTGALPGTELGRVTVTPTHYDFIDVDLSSLGISIDAGDFYIAHIQGGAYPNCLPTAIDETLPTVNRSYSRYVTGGGDWAVSDYQDFMIRATVNGPRGTNDLKEQIVTFPTNGMTKEMFVNGSSPRTLEHYVDPKRGNELVGNGTTRDIILLGYNVYEVTKGFVAYVEGENNTEYLDDIVAVGTEYTYWATAVYDAGESAPSNTDSAIPLAAGGGYHEPFDVNWTTTGWTTAGSPNNWGWLAGYAVLNWSPAVINYDMSLISPEIDLPPDPLDVYDLTVSMYLNNYTSSDGEVWEIWLIHDGGEDLLWSWDDPTADWGFTGGTDWVYTDTGQYAGQSVQLKFRSHGGTTFNFDYWYIYDVLFDYAPVPPEYGALEGVVTDGDLVPLEGVAVDADLADYNTVYTDENGYYSIDPMKVGLYDVTFSKVTYCTITVEDVEIVVGETTLLDVILGMPTMDIEPTFIDATVPVGGTDSTYITVTNNGDAPLDWGASLENQTELLASMIENSYTGVAGPSFLAEVDPGQSSYIPPEPTEDMWDILFNYDVDTPTGGQGIAGAGFGNGYFLVSEWGYASRNVFKFDAAGNYISSWIPTWMPGTAGLRDMAFDGEYFYASNAGTTIYQFDEDGNNYGTISSPVAVRSIAYDSDSDAFWVNNWSETLTLISRTGSVLNTIPTPPSMYGSAYDNVSAGGPYLWIFTGTTTGAGCQIEQYNLNTLTLTGVTHDVDADFGVNSYIAGGLFASGDIVPGTWVLGGLAQGTPDILFGYELGPYATWIRIDPTSGTVPPGCDSLVTVYFDAGEDPAGTIHTCDIFFESDPDVGTVTVPVTLMVGEPEYGNLNGYVTAATGGAPIDSAEIIAGTYTAYTDVNGYYEILNMMVGYYTVECTAVGYNYQVVPDVPIVLNQTTPQDFALTAPIMVVDPLSINVIVPPGSTDSTYFTIYNNGDGEMNFDITLYDYGKVLTDYSNCSNGGTVVSKNGVQTGPGNSSGFQADGTKDEVIIHYDGENYDAIGLTSGGTFMVAARFTSDELGIYYDTYEITGVELYINDTGSALTLKIWEGGSFGNPGSEIYSQDVFGSIVAESWNILDLTTNVPLLAGNEYWVGYETTHLTGEYPAGCDAGPAVVGKGDWIYLAPGPWDQLHILVPSLNYNWNIRMVIDFGTPPWIIVDPLFGTIPAYSSMPISVMFDATELTQGEVKTADIEIVSDPDVGVVTVPVTMYVDYSSACDEPVKETKLYANFPNPMFNTTTFNFSLKDRSHVTLSIYNVKGQLVGILLDEDRDPNAKHTVVWDGTANGKQLANGIYFYKLETNSKTFLKKMILMK